MKHYLHASYGHLSDSIHIKSQPSRVLALLLSSEFRDKTKRVELPFLESRSRGMRLGSNKRAYAQIQGSRRFELAQIQSHICPGGEAAKRIQPADSWKRGSGREELPRGPWAPARACRGTPSPPRRRAAAQTATAPAETLAPAKPGDEDETREGGSTRWKLL